MRATAIALIFVVAAVVSRPAQRQSAPARGRVGLVSTDVQCAAHLGTGVKSNRSFCDVLVGNAPAGSVMMTIPPRTGVAMLHFDLHNRFTVPALAVPGILAFARHEAVVSVIQPSGDVIGRAAVVHEFRSVADL